MLIIYGRILPYSNVQTHCVNEHSKSTLHLFSDCQESSNTSLNVEIHIDKNIKYIRKYLT